MERNYLRMIRVMIARSRQGRREWSVYIARCADDSLYTGIAKNVEARIEQHNRGQGSAYARSRRPVAPVYVEKGMTRSQALVREAAIKAMPRPRKEKLVKQGPPKRRRRPGRMVPGGQALPLELRSRGGEWKRHASYAPARAQRKVAGRSEKARRL